MSVFSRVGYSLVQAATSLYGTPPTVASQMHWQRGGVSTHKDWCGLLRAFYYQAQLYDSRGLMLYTEGINTEPLKVMRTAAYRAVEFYVSTVWPTEPEIETENEAIIEAIRQVWQWSGWERERQVMVRQGGIFGDAFLKVAVRPDNTRVFYQLIDSRYVTDFDTDERGFLTRIRLDIPVTRTKDDGKEETITYTELWERNSEATAEVDPNAPGGVVRDGRVRKWRHTKGDERNLTQLGEPYEDLPLSAFGIDFIPIVKCPLKDIGEQWGMSCFAHAVDKIMEADRQATRLAQMLFRNNRNTWFIESPSAIADGRPANIPPPRVPGLNNTSSDDGGAVDVGGEFLGRLPAGWTAKSQVPQLQYDSALNILNAHLAELTRDLPELLYYDAAELGANASGRARRIHLTPAIDRAIEARANFESALIRANMMALTMGANATRGVQDGAPLPRGMEKFRNIGTYENGDFEHTFKERGVLPADELEDAQALKAKYEGLVVKTEWLKSATDFELEADGYTAEDIARIKREREASAEEAMERELAAMERAPRLPASAEDDTEAEGGEA